MLIWSEEYATGAALIDAQHRILIDQFNRLEQLLAGPPPERTVYDELLNFLGSYVETHFKFEEDCMESYRCPAREKNKLAHSAFIQLFANFKMRYAAEGPRRELLAALHKAAAAWILDHILTLDTQLRPCVIKPERACS